MLKSSKKSSKPFPSPPNSQPPRAAQPRVTGEVPRPEQTGPPVNVGKPLMRLPLGFGLSLMLESRFFLAWMIFFMLYIYAAQIANEWVYLLAASFLVSLVLGFWLPLLQVLEVNAGCSIPEEVLVSETAQLFVVLKRNFLLGPISFLIPISFVRMRTNLLRRRGRRMPPEPVLSPHPVYVESLENESWLEFPTPELKRGIYILESIELTSCFPFGLAWWRRTIKMKTDLLGQQPHLTVHPKVLGIAGNFLFNLRGITATMGLASASSVVTVQSTSVRSVREFKSGDSLRLVHWASSAKQGKLLVREFDSETLPIFDIILDLRANWRNQEQFELAVSLVHSLIHVGHKLGRLPELTLNPPLEAVIAGGYIAELPQIPPGLARLSEILARVEPITEFDRSIEKEMVLEEENRFAKASERPLLSVIPSNDSVMKYSPTHGDQIVFPVQLTVTSMAEFAAEEEELPAKSAKESAEKVQFKAARGGSDSRPTKSARKAASTILATLDGEESLAAL